MGVGCFISETCVPIYFHVQLHLSRSLSWLSSHLKKQVKFKIMLLLEFMMLQLCHRGKRGSWQKMHFFILPSRQSVIFPTSTTSQYTCLMTGTTRKMVNGLPRLFQTPSTRDHGHRRKLRTPTTSANGKHL